MTEKTLSPKAAALKLAFGRARGEAARAEARKTAIRNYYGQKVVEKAKNEIRAKNIAAYAMRKRAKTATPSATA